MDNFRLPAARGHKRTPVSIDVTVNGILNLVDGRITDLSEGGARIDGASMPARPPCEIHYSGQLIYSDVMWEENDRMGVRFPYAPTTAYPNNPLQNARRATILKTPH